MQLQRPEDRSLVEEILRKFTLSETAHKAYDDRFAHYYALYHNYNGWKRAASAAPDKDVFRDMSKKMWGDDLFIPYSYWTVETIVPRMLSNRPKMLVLPGDPNTSEESAQMLSHLIDLQQSDIDYELILQDVAKQGLITGLGIQKTVWRKDVRTRPVLERATFGSGYVNGLGVRVVFDGPFAENVAIEDFFWDPIATGMQDARYAIHRTWRDNAYVMTMLSDGGPWQWPDTGPNTDVAKEVAAMGSTSRYTQSRAQRQRIDGTSSQAFNETLHEVWEFHDGDRVVTLLDREIPVQNGPNPCWHGEIPFQIYRPTRVPGRFVGKGEIEPIEDLQQELNMLRSSRMWNSFLVLQRPFFYNDGLIDPSQFVFGPGVGIPVNGNPAEIIYPAPLQDIPSSSYNEEAAFKEDITRTSGISDQVAGTATASSSATEAQLVMAAASVRIQNKTRLIEVEVIKRACRQWIDLDQQHILQKAIRVPVAPTAENPDARWQWVVLTPKELQGEFVVSPEGGASAPANVPQDRQDAQFLMALFEPNPHVDSRDVVVEALKKMGYQDPTRLMGPKQPMVPAQVLQDAVARGADPNAVADAIDRHTGQSTGQAGGPPAANQQPKPAGAA